MSAMILVGIPHSKKVISVSLLFKALGCLTDKGAIIEYVMRHTLNKQLRGRLTQILLPSLLNTTQLTQNMKHSNKSQPIYKITVNHLI